MFKYRWSVAKCLVENKTFTDVSLHILTKQCFLEDIQIVFSYKDWEALAEFTSPDVHRQVRSHSYIYFFT